MAATPKPETRICLLMSSIVATKFGTKRVLLFSSCCPHITWTIWALGSPTAVSSSNTVLTTRKITYPEERDGNSFFIFGIITSFLNHSKNNSSIIASVDGKADMKI